ncbi:MAG: UbiA family prenyltransferase [Mycobacteriaceae bacterium]
MVRALVGSCHPGPTVAVTVLALLLGVGVGESPARVALLGLAVLAGQLSVGWSNDAVDADRDARTGRSDKPAATGAVRAQVLWRAATLAAVLAIVASLVLGLEAGLLLLVLVAAGWAYNLGVKATWWSGVAYLLGFGALPAGVYSCAGLGVPWWAPVTGALIGLGAHVANVLPDLADDAATGVRGLPHRLGARGSALLLGVSLAAAAVIAASGPAGAASTLRVGAAVLAGLGGTGVAGAAWLRPDSRVLFPAVVGLALLTVVLFVTAV